MSRNIPSFRNTIILLSILINSKAAFGQDLAELDKRTSQQNRMAGRYTLLLQPIGLGEGLQTAIRLEFAPDRDQHLGILYQHGEELSDIFDTYSAHSRLLSVYFKRFTGNSFYYELGFAGHQRTVETKDSVDNFNQSGSSQLTSYDYESYTKSNAGVMVGFGNQWQWDNFTLGCEWIGAYVPLTSLGSDGHAERHYASGEVQGLPFHKRENSLDASLRALNFSLGWQF